MWKFQIAILSLLAVILVPCGGRPSKKSCTEKEESMAVLKLVKDTINNSKGLIPECEDIETHFNKSACGRKEKAIAHINVALKLLEDLENRYPTCDVEVEPDVKPEEKSLPSDCWEVMQIGHNKSGIYRVHPKLLGETNRSFEVFCDLEKDGGGWTVIQRRGTFSSSVDFFQDWDNYKRGFGNLTEEFWLGNENIYFLTNQSDSSVRFDMEDVKKERRHALYGTFSLEGEADMYRLHIDHYSGDAGEAMMILSNEMMFSTKDNRNDKWSSSISCAQQQKSGWWFNNCCYCNPNGVRMPGASNDPKYMSWWKWKSLESMNSFQIKIRRNLGVKKSL